MVEALGSREYGASRVLSHFWVPDPRECVASLAAQRLWIHGGRGHVASYHRGALVIHEDWVRASEIEDETDKVFQITASGSVPIQEAPRFGHPWTAGMSKYPSSLGSDLAEDPPMAVERAFVRFRATAPPWVGSPIRSQM